jgi:hypothetical protein
MAEFEKTLSSARVKTAIAIVAVIFLVSVSFARALEGELLRGVWRTSEEFNLRAGLRDFVLTIDKADGNTGAYFLAYNDGGKILSNPAVLKFKPHLCLTPWVKKQVYWLDIDFLGEETAIDEKQKMTFYPIEGKLILSHVDAEGEETDTAVLFRDSIATFRISEE